MNDAPESRAGAVALMVLGVVIALACASAIGAVTTLVVMALDKPASAAATLAGGATIPGPSNTQEVVVRSIRNGPAVMVQARAEESAR
jgi:hypothetical protein